MSFQSPMYPPPGGDFQNGQRQQNLPQEQQHVKLQTPPSMPTTGLNKYLPPTSTMSQQFISPSPQAPPSINSNALSSTPTSAFQNTQLQRSQLPSQPGSQTQSQGYLPPHLRAANTPLTPNGGSANSSRTSSPALNSSAQNANFSQQRQVPGTTYSLHSSPANPNGPLIQTHAPTPVTPQNLQANMQNLSLNKANNGPLPPSIPTPAQKTPVGSYPTNFNTSALNTATGTPTSSNQNYFVSSSAGSYPMPKQPPTSNQQNGQSGGSSTSMPSNVYGVSTAPPMYATQNGPNHPQLPAVAPQNLNYLPPMPASQVGLNPNIINNNMQQQPIQNFTQSPMAPGAAPQQLRKPMYPSQKTTTPQAYSTQGTQGYPPQVQQTPLSATFNGQPNTAPLQYQQSQYPSQGNQMGVTQQGFSRLWGQDTVDLMQNRHILSAATLALPKIVLHNQFQESVNCSPDIVRCTLAKIPESNTLLQKSRLPLGLLIHPFRDINNLPVIQCPNIVRCRLCRTYINPFVYFVDTKMWKCNLCYRVNELPEDFQFDPSTKTYGDVTRRPEIRNSTIEFIAPSEYMLRPPQPAIYLFLFDVSIIAQQSGYLENACNVLSKYLDDMPGDARTQVGFIAYNSAIHFYSMAEGYNQPHEMTLVDIEDPFLPCPDNLLVNLKECKDLIKDLLSQLPNRFAHSHDPGSAMGPALQVAYKLMMKSGGRVTVFQTCLPNKGVGALQPREDPNNRSAKDVAHLNPATDFYKRHALECSGYQIAVDLFLLNQQYSDMATISGMSKHSGGSIHHFPLYQKTKPQHVYSFKKCFRRYLVRKIGFEAVMRIRCTRGLQVHTFHGNFFVRSTDLLSLPNVNPDAGYGMQISYDETLTDVKSVCFQAALLYTNSEGERRIRVHTLCLPVTSSLSEVLHSADAEAVVGLLSKMAVDRSLSSNVSDARDAFINATVDILSAFRLAQNLPSGQTGQLMAPVNLALLPLYILALLKHTAFRVGTSTRLDDRIAAMDAMKTLPLDQLIRYIYPEFYIIDCLFYNAQNCNENDDDDSLPDPPRLQLSAEYLDSRSMFLIDSGPFIIIYVGLNVPQHILQNVLGVQSTAELPDYVYGLPEIDTPENDALKSFINSLNEEKPYMPAIQIIRDTSTAKPSFIEKLVDDRSESNLSYYEFLQHLRTQVK